MGKSIDDKIVRYADVEEQYEKIKQMVGDPPLSLLREKLEKAKPKIPLFAVINRLKEKESIYLKAKRKGLLLHQIEDYVGFRVLCLFEQDLFPVFSFLLNTLKDDGYKLNQMEAYNWKDMDADEYGSAYKNLVNEVHKIFPEGNVAIESTPSVKSSGYKSIHLNACKNDVSNSYPLEIQLRTLFQDVWGELEHALSYKQGNTHPYIKKSFSLLSSDLQTADNLIANLRDISDKEKCAHDLATSVSRPQAPLAYETSLLHEFLQKEPLLTKYDEIARDLATSDDKTRASEATILIDCIMKLAADSGVSGDQLTYWEEMERAYIQFCTQNYIGAKKSYEKILEKAGDRYVPYFRLGEIHFILGDLKESLIHFDVCEEKLVIAEENMPNKQNLCLVKERIANVLWLIGEEYYDLAAKKIKEAVKVLEELNGQPGSEDFVKELEPSLKNYLCYYCLESYILAKRKLEATPINKINTKEYDDKLEDYENKYTKVKDKFNELKINGDCSAGRYDTAAWICYHIYLKEGNESYLNDADKYIMKSWGEKIEGVRDKGSVHLHAIESSNIRRLHTQEIKKEITKLQENKERMR